jgi:KDO2-lipid IV(A) lauroyltransferase
MAAIFFYSLAAFITKLLPISLSYWIAERAGDIAFWIRPDLRRAVRDNLRRPFGEELTPREMYALNRRIFRNFAKSIVDFLRMPSLDRDDIAEILPPDWCDMVRKEHARGKGIVFLSAHLGNWEMGGAALATAGFPLTVVALDHPTARVTEFFRRRRADKGIDVLSMRQAPRGTLTALRRGECVGLLSDRDFTDHGMMVRFFGSEARVPTGGVSLAMKTGASVFVVAAVRENGVSHRLAIEGPVPLVRTESKSGDLRLNVRRTLEILERYVREYPDQWFVFEPLWKA